MASGRAAAFVLVINPGWRPQAFFQSFGAIQGCRPPVGIYAPDFARNRYIPFFSFKLLVDN
jgi:hypothetical protein